MKKLFLSLLFVFMAHPVWAVDFGGMTGSVSYNSEGRDSLLPEYEITAGNAKGLKTLYVDEILSLNKSGSDQVVAVGKKLANADWVFGTIDASATPDFLGFDTDDAQDAGTGDFTLFLTSANDGNLFCAKEQFNGWGVVVSQGEGGSPVYAGKYYNGSSMATLTMDQAQTAYTAGEEVNIWSIPMDWARGVTSTIATGTNATTLSNYYCIEIIATTLTSQAVLGDIAWLMKFYWIAPVVSSGSWMDLAPHLPFRVDINAGERPICWVGGGKTALNKCALSWHGNN